MHQKPMKMNAGKAFRLIDFKTFDDTLTAIKSGSGGSSDQSSEEDVSVSSGDASQTYEPRQFMIQIFGVNEQGQTCSIIVHDFSPFFFLRVGDDWDQGTVNAFMRELYASSGLKWLEKQVESAQIVQYHKLYGFSAGRKDRFIQILFKNQNAFNRMKGLWYKKDGNGNRRLITIPF
ncbi:hypothetical protein EB093_08800, partial [bacterium]|nr:hypothetical protein [bacterium]